MRPFVPLARRTLLHEWRRFLPCAAAIACAVILIAAQLALVLGIFSAAAVDMNESDADLWMGLSGTQSIELGRPIPRDADLLLRSDPRIAAVEPFRWVSADWRAGGGHGEQSVFVSGIDPRATGLVFSRVLPPTTRQRLLEPGAVIVDRADLDKLGIDVGGYGRIDRSRVHLVAAVRGLRALGGISLVASLDTARALDVDDRSDGPAYYIARVRPGVDPNSVREDLTRRAPHTVQIWTSRAFARQTVLYWLFETGAGLGVLFITLVVTAAGSIIASQALRSALAPSLREYATLRAFGVSAASVRRLVIEKTLWLAAAATLAASLVIAGLVAAARAADAPAVLNLPGVMACAVFLSVVVLAAALGAVRLVSRIDMFGLLR